MDFLLTILVVGVVGLFKVVKVDEVPLTTITAPVIEDGLNIMPVTVTGRREVGNNLMLKCDTEAFTMILKEFGLD